MDFEEKERRLQHSFPHFSDEEIHHALDAAQGDYDLCASMLLETHEEDELQVSKVLGDGCNSCSGSCLDSPC